MALLIVGLIGAAFLYLPIKLNYMAQTLPRTKLLVSTVPEDGSINSPLYLEF